MKTEIKLTLVVDGNNKVVEEVKSYLLSLQPKIIKKYKNVLESNIKTHPYYDPKNFITYPPSRFSQIDSNCSTRCYQQEWGSNSKFEN